MPSRCAVQLSPEVQKKANRAICKGYSASTLDTYEGVWRSFVSFAKKENLAYVMPLSTNALLAFILDLGDKFCHSTVVSMTSAISFFHKINLLEDPTKSFLVTRVLKGVGLASTKMPLKPMTREVLTHLINALPYVFPGYKGISLKAILILAYHGAFRLGELVRSNDLRHTIGLENVNFEPIDGKRGVSIYLRSSKTAKRPASIVIKAQDDPLCAVEAMSRYRKVRPKVGGPFFVNAEGVPETRDRVVRSFKACLSVVGYNPEEFNGHSFRIGRATDLAKDGYSSGQIKRTGRWRSDAFENYIRDSALPSARATAVGRGGPSSE